MSVPALGELETLGHLANAHHRSGGLRDWRLVVAIGHRARKKNVVGVLPLPLANRKCGDAS